MPPDNAFLLTTCRLPVHLSLSSATSEKNKAQTYGRVQRLRDRSVGMEEGRGGQHFERSKVVTAAS